MELDKIPLWRGDHVAIRQLAEDFARYVYLPRLRDPEVLTSAVRDGLGLLLWRQESFAFADGYDEASGRYRGLRCGQRVDTIEPSGEGLLVKPEVAIKHHEANQTVAAVSTAGATITGAATGTEPIGGLEPGGAAIDGGRHPSTPRGPMRPGRVEKSNGYRVPRSRRRRARRRARTAVLPTTARASAGARARR